MRDAILSYKKSDKRIYAYSQFYSITDYYIASACDKVYSMPQGIVDLRGFSMTRTYIKDTLGKLGIKAQFVKIDEYKSAPEMFIENKGTKRDREQRMAYLNAVFDEYVTSISQARGIEKDEFTRFLDEGLFKEMLAGKKLSDHLIERKIIDDVKYLNEVVDLFKEKEEKTQKVVWHKTYKKIPAEEVGLNQGPVIALVYATGVIIDGLDNVDYLGGESAGSDTLSQQLRKARVDEDVKAVVIRVDSPGGSGTASEAILHEINRIKDAGKPVVVSMGNVAASGGYYISCQADKIVAQPTTITGSIGIFAGKFDMSGFYSMIGINRETIKRGEYADLFNEARPATEDEMQFLHSVIKDFYDTFLQRVADGRGKTPEEVNKIGRGRIWSGVDAKKNGLVDELGGMDRAIEIARELAGIKDEHIHLKLFPARKNLFEVLLGQAGKNTIKSGWASIPYLKFIPVEAYKILSLLELFAGREGFRIYAIMPEIITVN
jgi:protease-4